jgi:2-polyprenyl-3-methyl-5-hydroxy-6-metoxy-1,4-benzoquinol methylase
MYQRIHDWVRLETIDLQRTLIGGEDVIDAGRWAELTNEPARASMLLQDSPHVELLQLYMAEGSEIFKPERFEETRYSQNAVNAVRITGQYFGQRSRAGILAQARAFITLFERIRDGNHDEVVFPSTSGHSRPSSMPVVNRTLTRETVQIVHGQHRLSIAWVLGARTARAVVSRSQLPTELQRLVLRVAQTGRRRELYQPIDKVDFDASWPPVRLCADRFRKMQEFLDARQQTHASVIDLACSYGWFVSQFSQHGCDAVGVEADPTAIRVGELAYGLRKGQVQCDNILNFLANPQKKRDVVLLLSILHHFVMKPDFGTPEELIAKVDSLTGSVLFFDTGQCHEQWFSKSLPEWDNAYIEQFILRNTSFTRVVPLGIDADARFPYEDNYDRMLFACTRD